GLVDGNAVHDRVRASKIHMLKNARVELRGLSTLLGVKCAVGFDVHRLARRDIPHQGEARRTQRHAFRGNHVLFLTVLILPYAITGRANSVWISESDNTVTGNHRYHSVGATAPLVNNSH